MSMSSIKLTVTRWYRWWWITLAGLSLACASIPERTIEDASYQVGFAVCSEDSVTSAEMDSTFISLMDASSKAYIEGCEDAVELIAK